MQRILPEFTLPSRSSGKWNRARFSITRSSVNGGHVGGGLSERPPAYRDRRSARLRAQGLTPPWRLEVRAAKAIEQTMPYDQGGSAAIGGICLEVRLRRESADTIVRASSQAEATRPRRNGAVDLTKRTLPRLSPGDTDAVSAALLRAVLRATDACATRQNNYGCNMRPDLARKCARRI